MTTFNRQDHVYINSELEEIIKDTIRFFNGTPVYRIPSPERFHGAGVYAIYCVAKTGAYKDFHQINRTSFDTPIYVGKAVPQGWRQGRISKESQKYEMHNRIRDHSRSIELGKGLKLSDFHCRFMILESIETDLIGTVEAALIRKYKPIWNTLLDGFGNHDPGSGRYEQAKSDWDICHPGRLWAKKCKGKSGSRSLLLASVKEFMGKSVSNEKVD